jgi:hypothetical protein
LADLPRAGLELTCRHPSAGASTPARGSLSPGWQLRLCTWRRTAGCRPCVIPGAARHQLATVTPPTAPAGKVHPPGAPVLSRAKITVKGAPSARRTRWRCAPPRTVIFVGSLLAPVGGMARSEAGPDTSTGRVRRKSAGLGQRWWLGQHDPRAASANSIDYGVA